MEPGCYCLWWRTRTLQLSGPEAILCYSCHLKTQQLGVLKYSFHFLGCRMCWVKAALTGTTQKERAGFVHENVTAAIGEQSKGSSRLSGGARVQNRGGDISAVCGLGTYLLNRRMCLCLGQPVLEFAFINTFSLKRLQETMLSLFSSVF